MSIEIRKAAIEDVPVILDIVNQAILHSTAIYDYDARTLEQQKAWFEDRQKLKFPVIVALANDKVVGFGTYGPFRVKVAYQFTVEHSVYVTDGFKGKGIGKVLLSELIELAKLEGFHTMIGCIDADNGSSIGFHEKFGFTITGTIREVGFKFGKWLDLVIMQLILK